MLLAIDVGNTNIKLGVYDEDELKYSWRLSVHTIRTSDELAAQILILFSTVGIKFDNITGIILSSVAPSINYTVIHMCTHYINMKPLIVGPGTKTGMDIKYSNPQELGADRIVNSVAAYKLYGGPCIVIDYGTATTFNVVSEKGEMLGGVIAAGIKTSLESLTDRTDKLSLVELHSPKKAICRTTETNLQAGAILGVTGQTEYIIRKIKEELGRQDVKVIATGGLSSLINEENDKLLDITDRYLTLKGLKIIYDLNTKKH